MISIREWFLIGGVVVMFLGLMCLPLASIGIRNPKRDLSLFNNHADLGAFFQTGLVLMLVGAGVIVITVLVPSIGDRIRRKRAKSHFKQDTEKLKNGSDAQIATRLPSFPAASGMRFIRWSG